MSLTPAHSVSTAGPTGSTTRAGPSASASASGSAKVAHASSRLYDIEALANDGSNFQMWKFRMKKVLSVRNLWNVVAGTETTAPNANSHPDEYEEWLTKDQEACAQITLTLKDEPLSGVMYETSAAATWKKLGDRYEGKGKQSIAYIIGDLFRGTLADDQPMETQSLRLQW